MAFIKLKKKDKAAEKADKYAETEQGELPPPMPPAECDCDECKKLKKIIENQGIMVQNQQVILNTVLALAARIEQLAQEAPDEEEPTEEEIAEALQAARAAKKVKKG